MTRLWNATQHYRRAFMHVSGADRRWIVNAEHGLILDAVQRRDAVDAERYLSGHIRRTRIELGSPPRGVRPSLTQVGVAGCRAGYVSTSSLGRK